MTLMFGARRDRGFALPTILLLTVVLLIMLLAAISSMSTVRQALMTQQYDRMAQLAAESGVNYATDCLSDAQMLPEAVWTSPTATLTPNTDCQGATLPSKVDGNYVMIDEPTHVRATFTVPKPLFINGALIMSATGEVQVLRASDGAPWKTYSYVRNVKIGTNIGVTRVSFGYSLDGGGGFFTTISGDGLMLAMGANNFGQLGNGTTTATSTPTPFRVYGKKVVKAFANIVSQGYALFALTDTGELWGSGLNIKGQLGSSTVGNVSTPVRYQVPTGEKVVNMLSLGTATFVVTDTGTLYVSGACLSGQLGIGACADEGVYNIPQKVQGLPPPNTADPSTMPEEMVGDYRGVLLRMKGGQVYGWGINRYGELGTNNFAVQTTAVRMGSFGDPGQPVAQQIQFDGDTSYIRDNNGDVWCAGLNTWGELGIPVSTDKRPTLDKIPGLPTKIIGMSTDQWSVSMVGSDGNVYSLGLNNVGQLGNGEIGSDTKPYSTPQKFLLPAGAKAVDVINTSLGKGSNARYNNVFVMTEDGQVFGAGSNTFGQIGLGTSSTANVSDPANNGHMTVFDGTVVKAAQVLAGYGETIIKATNGRVYTVGNNQAGQLGDGTTTNDSTPRARQYVNMYPPRTYF